MKQQVLVSHIAANAELSKKAATAALTAFGAATIEALNTTGEITLPGIGKLKVKDVPERQGRNPQTGEAVTIPAHRKVSFVVAKALKDAIN